MKNFIKEYISIAFAMLLTYLVLFLKAKLSGTIVFAITDFNGIIFSLAVTCISILSYMLAQQVLTKVIK